MKKSYSLLSCFALFLLSLVLCCKPIKAAEPTFINLSDLKDGQTLEIKEDSVLNLDTDKSLFQINKNGFELTISGTGTVEIESVGILDSGKMIVNSGSVKYNCSVFGHSSLVVNGGSITLPMNLGIMFDHVEINGGYICGHDIQTYTDNDCDIRINGGHLELKDHIESPNLYIDEKMFVVEPWNKTPESSYYPIPDSFVVGIDANGHGVKIVPKSEVIFLDGISFNETTCTLEPGESKQLSVDFMPENASNKYVTWSSSDPSVAFVGKDGVVTAYKSGSTVIKATSESGELNATCEITVLGTDNHSEGLVIETSYFVGDNNKKQPYIKVKYNGAVLKEGFDYKISNELNEDTGLSTTTIIGLDDFVRKNDKK